MALHGLGCITIGVPDVDATHAYYADFGLTPLGRGRFASTDAGEQLKIVKAPRRRLEKLVVAADDNDDLNRIGAALGRLEVPFVRAARSLRTMDPGTEVAVTVEVRHRIVQRAADPVPGAAFLRCSTDHHNVLVQRAPVQFLHHTSWQVDDVDQVGRGATRMLQGHPERHVWGLGRHYLGSNFFWYLKDPAGNFSEYFADMDCIIDDRLWTPRVWEDIRALYGWGPPVPHSFIRPDDLAALMTSAHDPS